MLITVLAAAALSLGSSVEPPAPSCRDLTTRDVVTLQVRALSQNPNLPDDEGIRKTFAFASPANRAFTGPIDRFIRMVKGPAYAPLLGTDDFRVEIVAQNDTQARFLVRVRKGSQFHAYVWDLSRQDAAPVDGCWMTDAVVPVELPGPADAGPTI